MNFEQKEQKEQVNLNNIKVFRVRHGESNYDELSKENIDAENSDLTDEGVKSLEKTSEKLLEILNPETDLIVIASSERRRAMASAEIIDRKLREANFTIWEDPKQEERNGKARNIRSKINDMEIIDKESKKVVKPGDEKYWEASGDAWAKHLGENPEIPIKDAYPLWFKGELERLDGEQYESDSKKEIDKRSKEHLAFLMKVSQKFQPKLAKENKRIVIIEVEHGESLDSLSQKLSESKVSHGGFLELDIPTNGDEIDIKNYDNKSNKTTNIEIIKFNAKKRDFIMND